MKLVIDIDEEIYKSIKIGMRNRDDMAEIGEAVENGTPLPKGHSFIAICDSDFQMTEEAENILKDTVFIGDDDCDYCFDIAAIIPTDKEER